MRRLIIACFALVVIVTAVKAQTPTDVRVIITGQSLSNQILHVDEQLSSLGYTAVSQKFGIPGAPYVDIQAGTVPFTDSIAYGGNVVMLVHGEKDANEGTPLAEYQQFLTRLQADYSAQLGFTVPLVIDQVSSRGEYGTNEGRITTIARAQWFAAATNPNIYLVGPGYMYPRVEDMIHLTEAGNQWHGEQFAKVITAVSSGESWRPLEPDSITINGRVVTLTLHVPVPPLRIDTNTLPLKPNLGFEWYDDGQPMARIEGLTIQGNSILIYLDRAPTGQTMRLRYAHSGNGLATFWGNIKDSDGTPSYGNYDLANWLVHFDRPAEKIP